jgi:hypothetical protein
MRRHLFYLFIIAATCLAPSGSHVLADEPVIHEATEIALPGFEKKTLQSDGPLQGILFSEKKLIVLGKHNLWLWDTVTNDLQRIPLQKKAKGVFKLRNLGTDGINIYAASSNTLFQVHMKTKKVLRYKSPFKGDGLTLGFAGELDNMWWLHTEGFVRIDRYGKSLIPSLKPAELTRKDLLHFDAKERVLWIGRRYSLLRVDFNQKPVAVREALKTKHRLTGIEGIDSKLVVHTSHSLLRLDSNGTVKQPIPVEGSRKLLKASLSRESHDFLFSDRLLERYSMQQKQISRFLLPLRNTSGISMMRLSSNLCAILQNGSVRLFNLPHTLKKD